MGDKPSITTNVNRRGKKKPPPACERPTGRGQPALLEQLVHQFSHKLVPDLIALVFVTQTKNCKVFRNMDRNGVYNVKIAALCPAFFQDIICDLIPLGLQFRPIRFIAQIPVFLVAVHVIAAEGSRFR